VAHGSKLPLAPRLFQANDIVKITGGHGWHVHHTCTALLLSVAVVLPAAAQSTLTFASYGGAYQAAQRKALLDPIEKMMNITFKEDTLTGIADVRAQVRANAVKWDIADLGGASCARGRPKDCSSL